MMRNVRKKMITFMSITKYFFPHFVGVMVNQNALMAVMKKVVILTTVHWDNLHAGEESSQEALIMDIVYILRRDVTVFKSARIGRTSWPVTSRVQRGNSNARLAMSLSVIILNTVSGTYTGVIGNRTVLISRMKGDVITPALLNSLSAKPVSWLPLPVAFVYLCRIGAMARNNAPTVLMRKIAQVFIVIQLSSLDVQMEIASGADNVSAHLKSATAIMTVWTEVTSRTARTHAQWGSFLARQVQ